MSFVLRNSQEETKKSLKKIPMLNVQQKKLITKRFSGIPKKKRRRLQTLGGNGKEGPRVQFPAEVPTKRRPTRTKLWLKLHQDQFRIQGSNQELVISIKFELCNNLQLHIIQTYKRKKRKTKILLDKEQVASSVQLLIYVVSVLQE